MPPNVKDYNPSNWYWIVAGDESRVFSSATGDYVLPSDPTYVAWSSDGTRPTRILNETELGEVLADAVVRPTRAAILDAYQDRHARKISVDVLAKVVAWLVNDVRNLRGQPPLNAAQFRAFVKDKM